MIAVKRKVLKIKGEDLKSQKALKKQRNLTEKKQKKQSQIPPQYKFRLPRMRNRLF